MIFVQLLWKSKKQILLYGMSDLKSNNGDNRRMLTVSVVLERERESCEMFASPHNKNWSSNPWTIVFILIQEVSLFWQ